MYRETDVPEYFYADLPFNPNVDCVELAQKIDCEIKRHFPLWKDGSTKIITTLDNGGNHVSKVLYGSKKRSEFNSFAGLTISRILEQVYENFTGFRLDRYSYGWGSKEDGTPYKYNELYYDDGIDPEDY